MEREGRGGENNTKLTLHCRGERRELMHVCREFSRDLSLHRNLSIELREMKVDMLLKFTFIVVVKVLLNFQKK